VGEEEERAMEGEYDRDTLYVSMKRSQWNPSFKFSKKEKKGVGEGGIRKSNRGDDQSILSACIEISWQIPQLYN
jgi:hypothetical protein